MENDVFRFPRSRFWTFDYDHHQRTHLVEKQKTMCKNATEMDTYMLIKNWKSWSEVWPARVARKTSKNRVFERLHNVFDKSSKRKRKLKTESFQMPLMATLSIFYIEEEDDYIRYTHFTWLILKVAYNERYLSSNYFLDNWWRWPFLSSLHAFPLLWLWAWSVIHIASQL